MDGFTEIIDNYNDTDVVARFATTDEVMNKKPAAILKKLGKGKVLKLAFWPLKNQMSELISQIVKSNENYLSKPLDQGVLSVPRTDQSFFIINTTSVSHPATINKPMSDRISGEKRSETFNLKPYEILWLEYIKE